MLSRRRTPGGLVLYVSPLLERAGVAHAFSTRLGGVSPAPFDSLNLGLAQGADVRDAADRVDENYRRLLWAIGRPGCRRAWLHQVHGAAVCAVPHGWAGAGGEQSGSESNPGETPGRVEFRCGARADALVGDDAGAALVVKTADCVPVLLSSADGRVVSAVHAGWRGVVAGVVGAAVRRLAEYTARSDGGAGAAETVAAIGPCIGYDAFEVGPEVLAEFVRAMDGRAPVRRRGDGKGHVDLREAVRRQLVEAGLDPGRIDVSDRCTAESADEFFSHRRDGPATGRMAAVIAPAGGR